MIIYYITALVNKWIDDFVDEETGEVVSIERTEIKGYSINSSFNRDKSMKFIKNRIKFIKDLIEDDNKHNKNDEVYELKYLINKEIFERFLDVENIDKEVEKYLNRVSSHNSKLYNLINK